MLTAEKDLIVGGQAVIEGVMMRTPNAYAIAVRRQDGSIAHISARLEKWSDRVPLLKLPILRGGATLVQSMLLGFKALNYSAETAFAEDSVTVSEDVVTMQAVGAGFSNVGTIPVSVVSRPAAAAQKKSGAGAAASIAMALVFNVLLFIVAPLLLTNALFIAVGWANVAAPVAASNVSPGSVGADQSVGGAAGSLAQPPWYQRTWSSVRQYLRPVRPSISFNLIDGMIRMTFFISMIMIFSLMKDIRRVFEYHGAEHKTVFTWEAGLPLTVENARVQPRQHPRCGTSFLMVVMLVSIVLFSVIKFDSLLLNMLIRVALMPLVAGLSYEIIRVSARKESSLIFKLITKPGVWLQNITTKEPDDGQLEVALAALTESIKLEPQPQQA